MSRREGQRESGEGRVKGTYVVGRNDIVVEWSTIKVHRKVFISQNKEGSSSARRPPQTVSQSSPAKSWSNRPFFIHLESTIADVKTNKVGKGSREES